MYRSCWKYNMLLVFLASMLLHTCVFNVHCGVTTSTAGITKAPAGSTRGIADTTPPTTTPWYYHDYSDYAPNFSLGSSFCNMKAMCDPGSDISFPDKSCFCDNLCVAMGDCCQASKLTSSIITPSADLFSCIVYPEIVKNTVFGIMIVDKCPEQWTEHQTRSKCELYLETDDISLTLPVSDEKTHVMFKNMYCALCNNISDFQFWNPELKCPDTSVAAGEIIDRSECDIFYIRPTPASSHRLCPRGGVEDECPNTDNTNTAIRDKCINGSYSIVFANQKAYKNKYCALCFNEMKDQLMCEMQYALQPPTEKPDKKTYSFRLLVDFNIRTSQKNKETVEDLQAQCQDDEMYDPFSELCRKILCLPPLVASRGRCVYMVDSSNDTLLDSSLTPSAAAFNCTLVKYTESEYNMINTSNVFIIPLQKVYAGEDFHISGTDVYICLDKEQMCLNCSSAGVMFQFSDVERYVSLVSLIVSIIGLVVTFLVYVCFPQLLNTPGKILVCLVVALFFAQLLFIISSEVVDLPGVCKAIGILVHYFFLSAFCWMNIIALDLWMTFSGQFISVGSSNKSSKRLRLYNAYAWLVPALIVSVAVVLDHVSIQDDYASLKPNYGLNVCWIASRNALLLFFAGPLALFKLFDIVSFIFTSVHIAKAERQGAMATQKKNTCSLLINVKLSMIMGLTWVFAFVANAADVPALWYIFIVLNALQGLLIAISFLCTKKVIRLLREKAEDMSKSRTTTSGTQMTSLSKSDLNKI